MAARYDKYDGKVGGFRAPLAADLDNTKVGIPLGVGLDANGRLVVGDGNTGVVAVLVIDKPKFTGDIVDPMTDGEIVGLTGLSAGTVYNAEADGDIVSTAGTYVGHTVEAERLIVRVAR